MKASGVTQGFKWLADKLHPQLPLTNKESQRLLTALNSSFRRHLDETHPTRAEDDQKNGAANTGSVTRKDTSAIHSSARSYADKHLASVLTNPLFIRSPKDPIVLNYASAKSELAKNPQKDPLQLLEEYHAKNAATVRIAELCLETFHAQSANASAEVKRVRVEQCQPGRRVFLWLLNSQISESSSYRDNARFMYLLSHYLLLEGREENMWDWIKLDLDLNGDMANSQELSNHKRMYADNKWKGRLLHSMVRAKMGNPNKDGKVESIGRIHAAMDLFAKACEMKRAAVSPDDRLHWISLGPASSAIHTQLTWHHLPRAKLDAGRFDRFATSIALATEQAPMFRHVDLARLELCHPVKPSADRALWVFRQLLAPEPSQDAKRFLPQIREPRSSRQKHIWHSFMVRTLRILEENGQDDVASWVKSKIDDEYPELAHHVEENLQPYPARRNSTSLSQESTKTTQHYPIPFPAFT